MTASAVISIMCRDRRGLVGNVTEAITALGGDIFDMSAAVLGEGGIMYVAFSVWPDEPPISAIQTSIQERLGDNAIDVTVNTFKLLPFIEVSMAKGTHRIRCLRRNDNQGDLGALLGTFVKFSANLIRVHAERFITGEGWEYTITMEVNIPEKMAESCLKAIEKTATDLGYTCDWEAKADTG